MKEIVVAYWYGRMEDLVGIKHNQVYEYSDEKRNEIIDLVMSKDLNVMLYRPKKETLIIWIDDKRFQQR